ncbi:MAG TPA: S8 family serine peptidase [Rudaea sp.]|jgi:subtilisin family serine protease
MNSLPADLTAAKRARSGAAIVLLAAACGCFDAAAAVVHPRVAAAAANDGSVDALLVFADQSQPLLTPLEPGGDYRARRRALIDALKARAQTSQSAARGWLDAQGIAHRDFWIANVIQARVPRAALSALAARNDVARIDPNPSIAMRLPQAETSPSAADTLAAGAGGIAWGVAKVDAPQAWAAGITGQGIVIGGEDTGYQWDHPALKPQYRGWDGKHAHHNYNWHDAVHDAAPDAVCGNNSPVPCDPNDHGTHTAGTFAGDDGPAAVPRHQVGVAPGSRWIGCRNMDKFGNGTPARYIECMQWMLEPTNLQGGNPSPELAPDVVSNSWYCAVSEGCTTGLEIEGAVNNLVSGGIFYVAAAGNSGSACATIAGPPATYDMSFVVGATDSADALASFSSRGPVPGSGLVRPDVSAPGVSVCSSIPTSTYSCGFSGTSMATPHVAGAAALLMSAFPQLVGQPEKIGAILRGTATTDDVSNSAGVTQSCGGTPITQWPNYMAGYGRVDAWSAYRDVIFIGDFDG